MEVDNSFPLNSPFVPSAISALSVATKQRPGTADSFRPPKPVVGQPKLFPHRIAEDSTRHSEWGEGRRWGAISHTKPASSPPGHSTFAHLWRGSALPSSELAGSSFSTQSASTSFWGTAPAIGRPLRVWYGSGCCGGRNGVREDFGGKEGRCGGGGRLRRKRGPLEFTNLPRSLGTGRPRRGSVNARRLDPMVEKTGYPR